MATQQTQSYSFGRHLLVTPDEAILRLPSQTGYVVWLQHCSHYESTNMCHVTVKKDLKLGAWVLKVTGFF